MIIQVSALVIMIAFYGCYFIKMLNQRKKGITTDQIGKGKEGFVKFVETAMKAATYLVPAAEVISILLDTSLFHTYIRVLGLCVGVIGTAVFIISVLTMRDSWRAGVSKTDKTELVTDGIYQISRNPAFLGFDLVYIGILLAFFNWPLFAASLLAVIMFHLQIVNVEEDFLIETFGDEYLAYRRKVRRYLGRK